MDAQRKGMWLGVAAYVVWGVTPVFWNLVDAPALEVLAHRILWAFPILILVLALRRRLTAVGATYAAGRTRLLAAAAGALIAVNWGVYIWAVTNDHIVEASLGYFINPLVSVALGVVVLKERLRPAQRLAVIVAAVGVVGMTLMLGVVPWISLLLAFAFGFYGLLKKNSAAAPALEGLLGEVTVLVLPAAVFLSASGGATFTRNLPTALWFLGAGILTVVPLWMFGAAAQRVPLSTIGLLQYLAPTLQFAIGVTIYGESIAGGEVFGFVLVWFALAVFARDQVAIARKVRMAT